MVGRMTGEWERKPTLSGKQKLGKPNLPPKGGRNICISSAKATGRATPAGGALTSKPRVTEGVAEEAVRRYEDYLREVGSTLVEKALEVTGDYAQAERAALEILRSLDLPELGVRVAFPEARG